MTAVEIFPISVTRSFRRCLAHSAHATASATIRSPSRDSSVASVLAARPRHALSTTSGSAVAPAARSCFERPAARPVNDPWENQAVPEPAPKLDVRSFEQLRDALLARVPVHAPEWADHDVSDPGVTLLELFAFLAEDLASLEKTRPGGASETLAAVRERLEGRLEYIEGEAQRARCALARIEAASPPRGS